MVAFFLSGVFIIPQIAVTIPFRKYRNLRTPLENLQQSTFKIKR